MLVVGKMYIVLLFWDALVLYLISESYYHEGEGNGNPLQYSCLEIPWTEEPDRLQPLGSRRVGLDWATSLSLFTFMHWRRKWQPTSAFLPGESQGQRGLVSCRLWVHTESDMTEVSSSSIIMKECWIVLIFSCTYCDDHIIFIHHSVNIIHHIYWFAYVEKYF